MATVDDILRSGLAAEWQTRLAASFFDADAKREIIREIHQGVADRCADRKPDEVHKVQAAVTSRLVGLASRDATPPEDTGQAPTDLLSGPELEDAVIGRYPYPIAVPYRVLTEQESAAAAFGCLLDTFESLLHYLATVAVSAYLQSGIDDPGCNRRLLEILVKNVWSTGDLFSMLVHPVSIAGDCGGHLPYAALPGYLFRARGKPSAAHRVLESFITLRNRAWGHGAGRDEAFYQSILAANRTRLDQQLARLDCLTGWNLIRPVVIDDSGVVRRMDRLMGDRRRKDRPCELPLDPVDLPQNGGDVRAEKSILLVSADADRYLPLYPLSLFGFQLRSQGMYFLQRAQWQPRQTPRRLAKAHYVAYESSLQEHEEGPGEPAAQSLERIVRGLETRTGADDVAEAEPAREIQAADPDVELAEVVHEQQYHLRSFAGRQAVLKSYSDWIQASEEGGYLLILGPPGQGKSAVMAQLAHAQAAGGCLLHMVKSHRSPRRFVPSLIRQAARILGTSFGHSAYEGDIDDLRNSLVTAAAAVSERFGRAVIVVDALDELEASAERVRFLPPTLPPGVRVILTCRPDIPLVRELRSRLHRLEECELPPLSAADLPALLQRRFEADQFGQFADLVDWTALFQRLQGNPLFLQRALDRIEQSARAAWAAGERPKIVLQTLPASLNALFLDIYDEIAGKRGGGYTSDEGRQRARLIQLLCVAREPLGFEQLAELLEADGRTLTLEECRDRICEMSQYLLDAGGNRFQPWHQGLADCVRTKLLGTSGVRQAEAVFCQWLRDPSRAFRPYAVRHRVRHLIAAESWDELESVLTDLPYLEAKTGAGLVFELAKDFGSATAALPSDRPLCRTLELIEEALRHCIHFVARHAAGAPEVLFQSLWNKCWWYDCSQSVGHYGTSQNHGLAKEPCACSRFPLHTLLESWYSSDLFPLSHHCWIRSLRPPVTSLGTAHKAVLSGHTDFVKSLAYSHDGNFIVSGAEDCTVRIWDADTGRELRCLPIHNQRVTGIAISPDGRRIASVSADRTVRVSDLVTGQDILCLRGHTGSVRCVGYSPPGNRIVSGSEDATLRIWESASGELIRVLRGHEHGVLSVACSSGEPRIASGSRDGTVRIWDAKTGVQTQCLCGHTEPVSTVVFSSDSRLVVSGSFDGTLRVWELASGQTRQILRGHQYYVKSAVVTRDSRQIISGSLDRSIRIWDIESGSELHCFMTPSLVLGIALSPDERFILSGSTDNSIRVWPMNSSGSLRQLCSHDEYIRSIRFSEDGKLIVTRSRDSTRVWDATSGLCIQVLGSEDSVNGVRGELLTSQAADSGTHRQMGEPVSAPDSTMLQMPYDSREAGRREPIYVIRQHQETVFLCQESNRQVAVFPVELEHAVASPSGFVWAGSVANHLYILKMEAVSSRRLRPWT